MSRTIGLSQIAGAQFLHVYKPRNWINCGQAGPLGWTLPAALGVRAADPDRTIVALSGDYDFQFMIEELAVGAQHKLPYIHVVVNNAYLGLIRQAQRGFAWTSRSARLREHQPPDDPKPATASTMSPLPRHGLQGGPGAQARRVRRTPSRRPSGWMEEHQVPVVLEVILERVTNISMGTEIDKITEFEDLCRTLRRRADCDRLDRLDWKRRSNRRTLRTCREFAANLTMLFNELPFPRPLRRGGAAGFKGVEYLFPYDLRQGRSSPQRLKQNGLTQVLHNLPPATGRRASAASPCLPDRVGGIPRGRRAARSTTRRRSAARRSIASPASRPRAPTASAARDVRREPATSRRDALKQAGIKLLIEPINTRDIPGFFLTRRARRWTIIDEVGSDNLFLQYDIYHMQIMEGDLARPSRATSRRIAHMQLADNPGPPRAGHRRDQLSASCSSIIDRLGYAGWIGCEYKPSDGHRRTGLGLDRAPYLRIDVQVSAASESRLARS